ncbi:unnamed protein product [Camellia sinensis]
MATNMKMRERHLENSLCLSLSLSLVRKMGLAIQKELLSRFIQKMCDNGMVNEQFVKLQELKKPNTPEFVVRAVTLYCMAEHVKIASIDILRSCQAFDKNGCIQALNQTKKEFSNLRRNLETLVQMERKIIDLENGNEWDKDEEEYEEPNGWYVEFRTIGIDWPISPISVHVESAERVGIINDQFSEIQALKSDCLVQLINAYCVEVGTILSELKSCINLPDVDFSNFAAQAHKIEDKSLGSDEDEDDRESDEDDRESDEDDRSPFSSYVDVEVIGAEHVRRACVELIQACEEKHERKVERSKEGSRQEEREERGGRIPFPPRRTKTHPCKNGWMRREKERGEKPNPFPRVTRALSWLQAEFSITREKLNSLVKSF